MLTTFLNKIKLFFEKLLVWSETGKWKTKEWYRSYLKLQYYYQRLEQLRNDLNTARITLKSKEFQYTIIDGRTVDGKALKHKIEKLKNQIDSYHNDIDLLEKLVELTENELNLIGSKDYE